MSLFGCTTDPIRNCNNCPESELNKIVHLALVKSGTTIDKTSAATIISSLLAAEAVCNAYVIRNVSGTYDGGTFTEGKGPGKQITRPLGGTHQIDFIDFDYVGQEEFWNTMKQAAGNYTLWFFTDTRGWEVLRPLSISPKPAITDDNQTYIEATITVKWSSANNPISYAANVDSLEACLELFDFDALAGFESLSGDESTPSGTTITIAANDNLAVALDTNKTLEGAELVSGSLPTGITLSVSGDLVELSGSTASTGTYELTIRAFNACGVAAQFTITLVVS